VSEADTRVSEVDAPSEAPAGAAATEEVPVPGLIPETKALPTSPVVAPVKAIFSGPAVCACDGIEKLNSFILDITGRAQQLREIEKKLAKTKMFLEGTTERIAIVRDAISARCDVYLKELEKQQAGPWVADQMFTRLWNVQLNLVAEINNRMHALGLMEEIFWRSEFEDCLQMFTAVIEKLDQQLMSAKVGVNTQREYIPC
jgi:hypothetical protein